MPENNLSANKATRTLLKKAFHPVRKTKDSTPPDLHKLAFANSINACIIYTAGSGKIVLINNAARKLFGYAKKELPAKNVTDIFITKPPVPGGMPKNKKTGEPFVASLNAVTKRGKSLLCEVHSVIFKDGHGNEKVMATIAAVSENVPAEKNSNTKKERIAEVTIEPAFSKSRGTNKMGDKFALQPVKGKESNEKFHIAAKLSFEGIWEKNLSTGELFLGDSFEELFGSDIKRKKGNIGTDWVNYLHPDDKEMVEKGLQEAIDSSATKWELAYRFVKPDGTIASVLGKASIIRDVNGKAIRLIGVAHDISKQKMLEEKLEKELITRKKLFKDYERNFKLIFNSSSDILFDIDLLANKFRISQAYEKEFGYKLTSNMKQAENWIDHIHPDDKEAVVKDYKNMLESDAIEWKTRYRFLRKDDSVANVLSNRTILRYADGKAYRLIGSLRVIGKEEALEKRLVQEIITRKQLHKEYEENFKLIFDSSSDVLFVSDLIADKLTISGAYEKEFGYKITGKMTQAGDWLSHVHPGDQEAVLQDYEKMIASGERQWKYSYRFLRADNSVANVLCSRVILRNADGKAYRLIGVMHDNSKQKALQERLEKEITIKETLLKEYKESFKFIFNTSSEVLFDADLVTNEILFSGTYQKEFGYEITSHMNMEEHWICHIHPDDKEVLLKEYYRMLASGDIEWKCNYRFLKSDNSIVNIFSSMIVFRTAAGVAYRIMGFTQDMSTQKAVEERLEEEIKLKENQIADATKEAQERERLDIGKELDDNVNQLLSASRLYLTIAKQGGLNSEMFLNRSSEYTTKAIEELRKLTKDLKTGVIENFGLCNSIHKISRDMMEINQVNISCMLESFIEDSVNDKFKMNIYRIVQEALHDILGHATLTEIEIGLFQDKKSIVLSVSDDGVDAMYRKEQKAACLETIKSLAAFHNGTADFISQPGQDRVLTVTFPVLNVLLRREANPGIRDTKQSILVEKLKNSIVELAHSDEMPKTNFSEYLSGKFHHNYNYLARLFLKREGMTLKKFIVSHKIERVKELILYDELNLKQIAFKLHFSSKAHLSNQFKDITGLTPSFFKQLMNKRHTLH